MVQVGGTEGLSAGSAEGPSLGKEDSASREERCGAWQMEESEERMTVGSGAGRGERRAAVVGLLSVPYLWGPCGQVQSAFTRRPWGLERRPLGGEGQLSDFA